MSPWRDGDLRELAEKVARLRSQIEAARSADEFETASRLQEPLARTLRLIAASLPPEERFSVVPRRPDRMQQAHPYPDGGPRPSTS